MGLVNHRQIEEVAPATVAGEPADTMFLDVREPDEYARAHVPASQNVPLAQLEAHRFSLPINLRLVCVSRTGERADEAAATLVGWAFDAVTLAGGLEAWTAAGLPIASTSSEDGTPE